VAVTCRNFGSTQKPRCQRFESSQGRSYYITNNINSFKSKSIEKIMKDSEKLNKRIINLKKYITIGTAIGVVSILGAFLGGSFLGEYWATPARVYVKDLNNTGGKEKDIVVKSREGNSTVFMQDTYGGNIVYTPLNEYINSKKRAAASNSQLEIKAIEKEGRRLEVDGFLTR
jgi:hypothetical protein